MRYRQWGLKWGFKRNYHSDYRWFEKRLKGSFWQVQTSWMAVGADRSGWQG